jgi:hypothetical protein
LAISTGFFVATGSAAIADVEMPVTTADENKTTDNDARSAFFSTLKRL